MRADYIGRVGDSYHILMDRECVGCFLSLLKEYAGMLMEQNKVEDAFDTLGDYVELKKVLEEGRKDESACID